MLVAALTALLVATPDTPLLTFQDERIAESSSLVAATSGDLLYTANDSGDDARVFTVDLQGRTRAVHELPGVDAEDVEDAGLGPGPTLYLADIGDNDAEREVFVLDPMLATGGTLVATIELLIARGASSVTAICLLAAPEGLARVDEAFRDDTRCPVTVVTGGVDERLDERGYITPGLGDAGDRLYGVV